MKDMMKWPIGEKVQKLEQQRILELEELKKHLDLLKSSYINNPPGFEFQAEILAYETKINQLKSRISALESTLREKNSKQDSILREYENKNQELKTKIRSFESSKENELVGLKEMNERLKGQFEVKKEKRGELLYKSRGEESIKEKKARKSSRWRLKSGKCKNYGKENERNFEYRARNRDDYREKAEKNERALTEMNGVLVAKIQELERMKSQYHESINNVHMLEGKLLEKLQEDEVFIS